jgi:hypothetical protein
VSEVDPPLHRIADPLPTLPGFICGTPLFSEAVDYRPDKFYPAGRVFIFVFSDPEAGCSLYPEAS